jgi:putative ABC transport system permease protein
LSWIDSARQRLRELLRASRVDAELDEEVRDHFARELERQEHRGLPSGAARRQAYLITGATHSAKEAVADERTGHLLADLRRDLRFGAQGVRRNPGFATAVVLSLALGVGGTTAIFSVVHAVLLRPLAYPHSDQLHLVRVWWKDFSSSLSVADFLTVSEHSPPAVRVGAYYLPDGGFAMATRDGPEVVDGGYVTHELFDVLGVSPIVGRGLSPDRTSREILIGELLWQERFGSRRGAIGESLSLDGETFTIVGIMPAGFHLPGQRNDRVWVHASFNTVTRRGPYFLTAIARLPDGTGAAAIESALTGAAVPVLREQYGIAEPWRYGLRPLKDVLVGDTRQTLLLTFAAVGLVLLIAVANVANLLLARGTVRAREMAVRASLGAGRGRLIRQLLTESALLGFLGGAAGLALAAGIVRAARIAAVAVIPRMDEVRVDLAVACVAIASGIVAGLAAGLVPVVRLPWTRLSEWLRAGGRGASDHPRLGGTRQALVIAEIALALTVVASAALLVKTLLRVQQVDPGFEPDNVISFRLALPDRPYADRTRMWAFITDLERALSAVPGARSVASAMSLPPDQLVMSNNYTVEGTTRDQAGARGVAEWNVVTIDYFKTLGIRVRRGRAFDTTDRLDTPPVAIVNDAFVRRHFPAGDPLGRRIKGGDWDARARWITIVGVAADVPYEKGAWSGSNPTVYTAYSQNAWLQSPYVVIKTTADPTASVAAARGVVTALDARVPLRDVATMSERMHRSTEQPRFRGLLFSALGGLALVLAVTGLYSVMAYHVSQHRRDTAIRRALGARSDEIVRSTIAAGARPALCGIVLGVAGALAVTRSLAALLFQVNPRDPGVLAATAGVLAAAALVACAWPAMRAVQIDPATLLRDE